MSAGKPVDLTQDQLMLARLAGLDRAVSAFPADVAMAAQSAAAARRAMPLLDDTSTEPWPPMRVRTTP